MLRGLLGKIVRYSGFRTAVREMNKLEDLAVHVHNWIDTTVNDELLLVCHNNLLFYLISFLLWFEFEFELGNFTLSLVLFSGESVSLCFFVYQLSSCGTHKQKSHPRAYTRTRTRTYFFRCVLAFL